MAYIQDLVELIQLRLPKESLNCIELVNSGWSLNGGFWRTHFVSKYGASLPNRADYELEYAVISQVKRTSLPFYLIRKSYNILAKVSLNIDINRISLYNLLEEASKRGNVELVEFLLGKGADIHHKNDEALRLAVEFDHFDVVRLLLSRGANIHVPHRYLVLMATQNGNIGLVTFLLDRGVDMDGALVRACKRGNYELVKLLLERGADIHENNDSPIAMAAVCDHVDIVKFLMYRGVDMHARNGNLLKLAAFHGSIDTFKFLITRGAKIEGLENISGIPKHIRKYIERMQ